MEVSARGAFRAQLTKIAKAASEFLDSEESRVTEQSAVQLESVEDELCTLIERLTAVSQSVKTADQQVHANELIKKEDIEKDFEKICEYEDTAVAIMARLKNLLKRVRDKLQIAESPKELPASSPKSAVKLPKLELKKFGGDLRDWLPFWDQFDSAIHQNSNLTAVDKFQYLESSLFGAAKRTITGFTASATCYDAAISLLLEQYGNNDKLIDNYMQKLINIRPVVLKSDVVALRSLYNTVTACIRSLTALQIPSTQYHVMLKSILLRCLPADLRVDYHRAISKEKPRVDDDGGTDSEEDAQTQSSLCGVTDPYVQNIMRFLKKEVEALEKSKVLLQSNAKNTTTSSPTTAASLIGLNNNELCVFCNASEHSTKDCIKEMTVKQKRDILIKSNRCFRCAKVGHSSRKCKSGKFLKCNICGGKHITTMCDPSYKKDPVDNETGCNLCTHSLNFSNVFLKTARCIIASANNNNLLIRVIIDGGSQHSYIRESLVERLQLFCGKTINLAVIPFGSQKQSASKVFKKVQVLLKSQYNNKSILLEAIVVPDICVDVLKAPDSSCRTFKRFQLADHLCSTMEVVDGLSLLIGSDFYWQVISGKQRKLSSRLRAVETIFGWALQGCHLSPEEPDVQEESESSSVVTNVLCLPNYGDAELSTMWSLETIGIRGEEAEKEHMTEELTKTCLKKIGSRYEATIPWKDPQLVLQNNRSIAVSRLNNLTKRLSRDPSKLKEYDMAVQQMIEDGIAEPIEPTSEPTSGRIIYLPHRPVYKDTSTTTKLRIVFDASCHTKDIPSLNDQIYTGTNLLPDVFGILLNFRIGRIGVVADIEKAFLQIVLNEADRDAHRFIWYSSFPQPSSTTGKQPCYKDLRMTRVTFGVSCSPFILSATIRSHLKQEQLNFPETCKILSECFYVDDLVVSVDNEDECVRLYRQAVDIMGKASMNLRKWHSNSQALRTAAGSQEFPISQKVLGLRWSAFSDELAVPLDSVNSFLEVNKSNGTKRNILQAIARVYDPLGMVCPTMIKLKILFQAAWKKKLNWDESLPSDLMLQWNECIRNVLQLKEMTIPRAVWPATSPNVIYCHIFADASINVYGAVAYLQTVNSEGVATSSFLCAKSRVAPLKGDKLDELTLPKLELTAALIAARLCNYIKKTLRIPIQKFFLRTDSKITLHWIYGQTQRWKPYVQSRVMEIRRYTEISSWSHCSGKTNPADLLTRGISGEKLVSSMLWERGPDWLNDVNILSGAHQQNIDCGELSTTLLIEADNLPEKVEEPILRCEDFNSWIRLLRVTSWVFRFINHCKSKQRTLDRCLSKDELEVSEQYWLRYVQLSSFANDLRSLQKGIPLTSSSKVAELSPFLDEHQLLRVGGRLQMLEEAFDLKHPIILPGDHHITALIVDDRHLLTCHGGVSRVLTNLRDRFWVARGRQLVKKRLRSCIVCKKLFGPPASQPFAPLPIQRISITRPFDNVGLDFAGPLYYSNPGLDGQYKAYILIFTCAAIRAVHLELTTSLSTDSCLMAIRRFIARRGVPSTFLSDNAKTFRRAALELSTTQNPFDSNDVFDFLSRKRIKWNFIVERAPWWGGFWERLIRTAKNTLKVVIGKATLTFEQLRTVLSEAEAVINDRPLTYASNDPLELVPLTPSKFLIGWSAPCQATEDVNISESSMRELWKHRMKYSAQISKRWRLEYLQLLRSFHQSNLKASVSIKPGDVVLLFDPAKPRVHWKMVIVERIFLGRDGKARSCEIRFADGSILRRPVQLLYPLELSNSSRPEDVEN